MPIFKRCIYFFAPNVYDPLRLGAEVDREDPWVPLFSPFPDTIWYLVFSTPLPSGKGPKPSRLQISHERQLVATDRLAIQSGDFNADRVGWGSYFSVNLKVILQSLQE